MKANAFRDSELLVLSPVNLHPGVGERLLNVLNRQRFLPRTRRRTAFRLRNLPPPTLRANQQLVGATTRTGARLGRFEVPLIEVVDAMDRQVRLAEPAERVVSLVPSESASVADLAGIERLVGRTDYCVEPLGEVDTIPSVGGTKSFDLAAVQALRPDLVLANKEENGRPLVQALMAAGLSVHVSFPCTVDESLRYLESLALLLGVDADRSDPVMNCRTAVQGARRENPSTAVPVFVPIWKDPWMTFDGGAYASDVLEICGADNVFCERQRLYPLAADLGKARPRSGEKVDARDTRYPRIRLEEVVERGARVVLLPDEPYAFTEDDAVVFREIDVSPSLLVEPVDGKDLFWYGTRLAGAIGRITAQVKRLRPVCFGGYPNK